MRTGTNASLLDDLRAAELDLVAGRMSDPRLMEGLSFSLLYQEPLVLVARAGHPLSRRRVPVQAVLRHPLVVYGQGTVPRHHTESFFASLGMALPAPTLQTQDVALARLVVLQSDAVWITPLGAARDDLVEKRMVRLRIDTAGTEEPVGLLLRTDAVPSAACDALAALLRSAAAALVAAPGRAVRKGRLET